MRHPWPHWWQQTFLGGLGIANLWLARDLLSHNPVLALLSGVLGLLLLALASAGWRKAEAERPRRRLPPPRRWTNPFGGSFPS